MISFDAGTDPSGLRLFFICHRDHGELERERGVDDRRRGSGSRSGAGHATPTLRLAGEHSHESAGPEGEIEPAHAEAPCVHELADGRVQAVPFQLAI